MKVVWTLHDYKLLCPRYDCLRNGLQVCEECFSNKRKVREHKCMKNSALASFLAYKEAMKWTRMRLEAVTDAFICPSRFMADKMVQGNFDKQKLNTLCNFIDIAKTRKDDYDKENYYCYIGRLSPEKGIGTLIEAAKRLPYPLKIIGGGSLEETLRAAAAGSDIELLGYKHWPEIKEIVGKARFCVVPSEWYENNPLSVIESQCLGTPVLGSRIGGIPELIDEGKTGMLFESGNAKELKARIGPNVRHPVRIPADRTRRPEKIFGRKVLCKTPENIHFFIIRQKRSVFLQNGIDKYESFDLNRHCQSNMHYPGCHRSLQSG